MEGDTIVMGSDGLFDNIFDHEIISTIDRCRNAVEAGIFLLKQFTSRIRKIY